jgi:peptidyl-prolyl cis-trans isomerase C
MRATNATIHSMKARPMRSARRSVHPAAALLASAVFALSGMAPGMAQESPVVATIDGQPLTEADLAMTLQDLGDQFARVPDDKKRAAALQALIEIRLVSAKARANGAEEDEAFKRQLSFITDRMLHQALIDSEVAGKITDADIRARYDKEIADRPAENEVKARHILVKTEDEARKLIADLDGGAEFEKLANEHTTDPSGKSTGGDLGYFGAGMMVPEFEKAAFELAPGSYTKSPVQTQFGFHIIKVEDKRAKQPPEFDAVKDQVRSIVIRERYLELVEGMRKAAKVEINDAALKADLEAQK